MTVWLLLAFGINSVAAKTYQNQEPKKGIHAIYLPMADNYAGIVAFEKYRDQMEHADYSIERIASWPELRAYFMSGEVDMAFIMSPLAMDMFRKNPIFRCVSLMQRDGSSLSVNDLINAHINLPDQHKDRMPDYKVANAYTLVKGELGRPSKCAVSSLLSIQTVVLYKYLKDFGKTLALGRGQHADVIAVPVSPIKSPSFIKKSNSRGIPASFIQSLPWADVVETQNFGHVAWYSKDVIKWPGGHVASIAIATEICIKNKIEALKEVIFYLHQAGLDIEAARAKGGQAMTLISDMIRLHIPEHTKEAIAQSLRPDLNVINYKNLNVDTHGLKLMMELGVEAGILKAPINFNKFTDERFSTEITHAKHP